MVHLLMTVIAEGYYIYITDPFPIHLMMMVHPVVAFCIMLIN